MFSCIPTGSSRLASALSCLTGLFARPHGKPLPVSPSSPPIDLRTAGVCLVRGALLLLILLSVTDRALAQFPPALTLNPPYISAVPFPAPTSTPLTTLTIDTTLTSGLGALDAYAYLEVDNGNGAYYLGLYNPTNLIIDNNSGDWLDLSRLGGYDPYYYVPLDNGPPDHTRTGTAILYIGFYPVPPYYQIGNITIPIEVSAYYYDPTYGYTLIPSSINLTIVGSPQSPGQLHPGPPLTPGPCSCFGSSASMHGSVYYSTGDAQHTFFDPIATRGYPLVCNIHLDSQVVETARPMGNATFTYDIHLAQQTVYDSNGHSPFAENLSTFSNFTKRVSSAFSPKKSRLLRWDGSETSDWLCPSFAENPCLYPHSAKIVDITRFNRRIHVW